MAAGDTYRVQAWWTDGQTAAAQVAFLRQLHDITDTGANGAFVAWFLAWHAAFDPLCASELGEVQFLSERLPPGAPETFHNGPAPLGTNANPHQPFATMLYCQAFTTDPARDPTQLIALPGVTTDQLVAGVLTPVARSAWNAALQTLLAALEAGFQGSPWRLQIVPYRPLAYPLPDAGPAVDVARLEIVPQLRPNPITNQRLRA